MDVTWARYIACMDVEPRSSLHFIAYRCAIPRLRGTIGVLFMIAMICTTARLTLLALLSAGSFQAAGLAKPLAVDSTPAPLKSSVIGEWVKTEMYFSEYQANDKGVTKQQWNTFMVNVIEPVFPKGFTVHDVYGQIRHSNGTIYRGQTRLVVVVSQHTADLAKNVSLIVKAYHQQFPGVKTMSISMPVENPNFMGI